MGAVNIKLIEWKLAINIYDQFDGSNNEVKLTISNIRRVKGIIFFDEKFSIYVQQYNFRKTF